MLRLGNGRSSTAAIHKSLNPEWNEVIDLPIEGLNCLLLEVKCWDKDRFGKDYMGEFDVALEDAFTSGAIAQEVRDCRNTILDCPSANAFSPRGSRWSRDAKVERRV